MERNEQERMMNFKTCPYCGNPMLRLEIWPSGVGTRLVIECPSCRFMLALPVDFPDMTERENIFKKATAIWEEMGTIFKTWKPVSGKD